MSLRDNFNTTARSIIMRENNQLRVANDDLQQKLLASQSSEARLRGLLKLCTDVFDNVPTRAHVSDGVNENLKRIAQWVNAGEGGAGLYQAIQQALSTQPDHAALDEYVKSKLGDGYFLQLNALNEPMKHNIKVLISAAKRARWTNAVTRKDGVETTYEADWIKHLEPISLKD